VADDQPEHLTSTRTERDPHTEQVFVRPVIWRAIA
jgi:hypothetical protein